MHLGSISPNLFGQAKRRQLTASCEKFAAQFHQQSPLKLCCQIHQIYDLKFAKSLHSPLFAKKAKKAKKRAKMLMKLTHT
jgi:hypothetical protein